MPASLDEVWKHIEPHTPEFAFLHVATVFFTEGPVHWILGGEATFVASAPNILFNTRAYYDSRIGSSAEWIPIARAKEFLASALEGDIVTPHGTARIPRPKGGAELGTSHGKEFSFWREDGRWQYYYNRIQITSDYATRIFDSEILDAESRKLGAAGIWGIGDLFKSSLPGFNGGHSYTIHFDIVQPFDIQTDVSFSKDSAEICISVSERIDKSVLKILAREFQPNTIPRFPPEVQPDPIFVPLAKWERSGIRWESKVLVACSEGRSLEIRHVHRGQARAERVFHRPHGRISPIVEALPGVGES
ncbi:MAG: hypothetical protein IT452_18275, partial [Planctomycetia bacterium]|nr:hypothetical protein [Planctomycetia bacterium]